MLHNRNTGTKAPATALRALALVALVTMIAPSCAPAAQRGRHAKAAAPVAPEADAATRTSSGAANRQKRLHERFTHEDVLALLRMDDSVVPAAPPVHPAHTMFNRESVVPPMCYTRTEGKHNPCYVCHQDNLEGRPNHMNDGDLQESYSFSDLGATNHWRNLFEDRSQEVAAISDARILDWIAQDNYSELAQRLRAVDFKGYVPDLKGLELAAGAFDAEGFAKDDSHWVAFNYKPMPSTFWPTNGATDDVMIRLPKPYRSTTQGEYSRDVYKANLAIVEANIKALDAITVAALDEKTVGADLDGDGKLRTIRRITRLARYVGAASNIIKRPFLYPQDTEFLHSVRYVGVDDKGNVFVPARMKELRYMRKRWTMSAAQLYEAYQQEHSAKDTGQLPGYINRGPHGLDNEMGWVLAGFIENKNGRLRVSNYEETFYCMGCHTSAGTTIDSTFSFARKVDGAAGWGYVNLRGMPDAPSAGERKGEIATYLERAGGGGEFRSNPEMEARWFTDGVLDPTKVARAKDVYDLITPSRERALALNKAYRVIVEAQDYIYGRDATVTPPPNVYESISNEEAPKLPRERTHRWDIRLDWGRSR
ncbi:MAG TPA: hypothetical protein VI072_29250 [Polyangiaceae bacterium]